MKPAPFDYHAPESVADAVALLAELGDDAKPLAGGQSLVPMLALRLARFGHLVDLNRIPELRRIERTPSANGGSGALTIGATTLQATAEHDAEVAAAVPLVARALPLIGHFQIRNRGTIGGSLAHADPASELPAVALALDATFEVVGPRGSRAIPASEFFTGTWTTALAEDELLVATRFPCWSGRCGFAVREIARRHGDFAIAGAVVGVELDGDGRVARSAMALFGVGSTPVRAVAAEQGLAGSVPDAATLDEAGAVAARDLDPVDDVHAPAWYRTHVAAHLVTTALTDALAEARHV